MDKRFDWKEPWESVNEAMSRVLDDVGSIAEETFGQLSCRPAVSLRKSTSAYELKAAVPGLHGSDVDVAVEGRSVVLAGRWPQRPDDDRDTVLRDELPRGQFRRAVRLPERVDAERVEAKLSGGILTVRLPLGEPDARTEVPVEEVEEAEDDAPGA